MALKFSIVLCNKLSFCRGIFLSSRRAMIRSDHLTSVLQAIFPRHSSRRMFMSRENLRSSRTRRYDFALGKRDGGQYRQTFPLQRRPLGGSSRKDATRICMWDTRERGCLTSNSKYIRQATYFNDSWQFRKPFPHVFSRKIANIEISQLFSIL